jgi:DNA-binding IclR family transcriptional regulator
VSDVSAHFVFETALAYQRTAALLAAVKLDIFTMIGSEMQTADELASRTGASARGIRILCNFLTAIGLLKKQGLAYVLSPTAQTFLNETSALASGDIVEFHLRTNNSVACCFQDEAGQSSAGKRAGIDIDPIR